MGHATIATNCVYGHTLGMLASAQSASSKYTWLHLLRPLHPRALPSGRGNQGFAEAVRDVLAASLQGGELGRTAGLAYKFEFYLRRREPNSGPDSELDDGAGPAASPPLQHVALTLPPPVSALRPMQLPLTLPSPASALSPKHVVFTLSSAMSTLRPELQARGSHLPVSCDSKPQALNPRLK